MRNIIVLMVALLVKPVAADSLKLGAGGFAVSLPSYPGSEQRHHYLAPIPFGHYESDRLSIDRDGVTGHLWVSQRWQLDISANAGLPVKSDHDTARRGMADLDWRFELGPALKYYFRGKPSEDEQTYAEFYVRKAIATDFTHIDDAGWFTGINLVHQQPLFEAVRGQWQWTTVLDIRTASDKAHQYYYGVSREEVLPQRPAFDASGGYWGSQLSSGLVYQQDNWWLAGFARYQGLTGSQSEPSALLQQSHQWLLGLGVAWIFYDKEI